MISNPNQVVLVPKQTLTLYCHIINKIQFVIQELDWSAQSSDHKPMSQTLSPSISGRWR